MPGTGLLYEAPGVTGRWVAMVLFVKRVLVPGRTGAEWGPGGNM